MTALSDDGRVIVGGMWRWSRDDGLVPIPRPVPAEHWYWYCGTTAVSADGSRTFLSCQVDEHHVIALRVDDIFPFVWSNGTFTMWERMHDAAYAFDVTPDGMRAVGYDFEFESAWLPWEESTDRATVWYNGPIVHLPELAAGPCGTGADDTARAVGISDDGMVIVGNSGETGDYVRPVLWKDGVVSRLDQFSPICGIIGSNSLRGGDTDPVHGISGDGRFAYGNWSASDYSSSVAMYWPIDTRVGEVLRSLDILDTHAGATCSSRDGELIGGYSGTRAVIWHRSTELATDVVAMLQALGLGQAISGWHLTRVDGISADGKQIAGHAVGPDGQASVWWADLRNPPVNDDCSHAITLNPNHTPWHIDTSEIAMYGTTVEATAVSTPGCASTDQANAAVSYKYTAPVDGFLSLNLCETSGLQDPYISVHTGCPANFSNEVLCSNTCPEIPGCAKPCVPFPMLQTQADVTYYIEIGGRADAAAQFVLLHRFLPLNDDCADALPLGPTPTSLPGTTGGMTIDTAPTCAGVPITAPTVWYEVIGSGTLMTAQTCVDNTFDPKLSVYCGGCGAMTCIGANDDTPGCGPTGTGASVTWCSAAGSVYHIAVHGWQLQSGNFRLDVTEGASCPFAINCDPANDECEQAIPTHEGTLLGDNTSADTGTTIATCAASSNDVWFSYHARCDGELWVDTCQLGVGSIDDSVISIYDMCDGTEIACNDDYHDATIDCQRRSVAITQSSQDLDVVIRVAGYGLQQLYQGTFPLRVTEVAYPLQMISESLADAYLGEPYASAITYYGGCGARFTSVGGLPPGLTIDPWNGLISGTPQAAGAYFVEAQVCIADLVNPECDSREFVLRVWPTNDACAEALLVTEGAHQYSNSGATTDGPNEPALCSFAGYSQIGHDIWYQYRSTCDGTATVDLCQSSYDSKMAVYEGWACPTTSSADACNDDACGLQSRVTWPVVDGGEYLIRIGGYDDDEGSGTMLLACINDCNQNGIDDAEEITSGAEHDCNANSRPDSCDVRGDYDADGEQGLSDLPIWLNCLLGPCLPVPCDPPAYTTECCAWIDHAADGDVDLADIAVLQRSFGN